jgi:hypothetical protein
MRRQTSTPAKPFSVGFHCAPRTTAPGGTEPGGGPFMAGLPPNPRFFEFTLAVKESRCLASLSTAAMYCLSF